jgi:competence protein ComEC
MLTGTLREDAAPRPAGISLSVDVHRLDDVDVRGGVLLTVGGSLAVAQMERWRAGRTIRAAAAVRKPTRYLNPGASDEERSLALRGTTLVGTVKSGALVEVISKGGRASEAAGHIRAFVRRAIDSAVGRWSERSAAIVTAIVIGDRSGLSEAVRRRLQDAGTYHVIAISGGNIAILAGLTLVFFRVCGFLGRAAMLTAIAGLASYCYVVGQGGGASVQRATFMAIGYFGARAVDLRGPPANALAAVAAMLVVLEPLASVDPAFLLTCGATAAILAVAPLVQSTRIPRTLKPVLMLLAASIAAEIALLPLGALLFSRVTFAGLVLNFAAIPLMAVAQLAGLAVLPLALLLPSMARLMGWVAHMGAEGLVQSAGFAEVSSALGWRVAPPSWPFVGLYYTGALVAWMLWRRRGTVTGSRESSPARWCRRVAASVAVGAAIWIVWEPWTGLANRSTGRLRVTFLDVRQGDAVLVRFPRGTTLLMDAGGQGPGSSFDVGDRVVAPVLRWFGIRRLDVAAISHAHPDHAGGMDAIVREFRPRGIWEGVPVPPRSNR